MLRVLEAPFCVSAVRILRRGRRREFQDYPPYIYEMMHSVVLTGIVTRNIAIFSFYRTAVIDELRFRIYRKDDLRKYNSFYIDEIIRFGCIFSKRLNMIQIFCSRKLHEFVGNVEVVLPTEGIERNLNNWNGHLFFLDRKKCLVFVNNLTNYFVIMPDKGDRN